MLYSHSGGENEVVAGEKLLKKHRHRLIRDLLFFVSVWRHLVLVGQALFYNFELVY